MLFKARAVATYEVGLSEVILEQLLLRFRKSDLKVGKKPFYPRSFCNVVCRWIMTDGRGDTSCLSLAVNFAIYTPPEVGGAWLYM